MKKLFITTVIAIALSLPLVLSAQPPHPNNGNGAPGGGNTPVGGGPAGAPIGSGTVILTLLAAAYGSKKACELQKAEKDID